MAKREPDTIELRGASGVWDRFREVSINSALNAPSEAQMVIGDVRSWNDLEAVTRPGEQYELAINGRTILKGFVEAQESPGASGAGVTIELAIRTRVSDARYASADPAIRVTKTSIKDFILALFEQHGMTEADFYFAPRTAVDLLTGKSGPLDKVDLAPITVQQAKVQLPETPWECATRHLARHGMTLWESPDGRVCVGFPDDAQTSQYKLICRRDGPGSIANNVIDFRRIRDWRDLASDVAVFGSTDGKEGSRAPIRGTAADVDVLAVTANVGHFYRPIRLPAERAKNATEAELMAVRELSTRRRRKDAWEIRVDGWTYWDGTRSTPWATNAVTDVEIDAAGGPVGPYLIWRAAYRMGVSMGQQTSLAIVAPGIWDLGGKA